MLPTLNGALCQWRVFQLTVTDPSSKSLYRFEIGKACQHLLTSLLAVGEHSNKVRLRTRTRSKPLIRKEVARIVLDAQAPPSANDFSVEHGSQHPSPKVLTCVLW
jgi:hypothetical protein